MLLNHLCNQITKKKSIIINHNHFDFSQEHLKASEVSMGLTLMMKYSSWIFECKRHDTSIFSNQSFKMVWSGNILILTLALVFMTDGSTVALTPFVYNSLFRQIPELDTFNEKGNMFFKIYIIWCFAFGVTSEGVMSRECNIPEFQSPAHCHWAC